MTAAVIGMLSTTMSPESDPGLPVPSTTPSPSSTPATTLSPIFKKNEARKLECEKLHEATPTLPTDAGLYCPRTFDGWSCWNDTLAGTTATVQCPDFVVGFDPKRFGHKLCKEDGTWFVHPENNQTWSNYTSCVNLQNLEHHQAVIDVHIAGYSCSLVALLISLFIFCFFKSLKCKRITIHKNLFLSFIIHDIMWLIWYKTVAEDARVLMENNIGCQILHVLVRYFMVANYLWMFCEGLYLHTLLVVAFVAEDRIMKWFYLLGWGVPAILTIIYGVCRGLDPIDSEHCWINEESNYRWILNVPVVLSMLLNTVFLINIVRVLVTKLRAVNTAPDTRSNRKAVRAVLILIPLLGLHYMLLPFRPSPGTPGEEFYSFLAAVAASFQGLGVALLFCFFNGEVLAIFRKKWNQHKLMNAPQSYAATTFSYVKSSTMGDGGTFAGYGSTVEGHEV